MKIALTLICVLMIGCAGVQRETFELSNGSKVDYIHGKVDADGQTGVFRDAFIDGIPVLSHFGSGQSLIGQVLQGAASSAMIAGGMVGAAAVLRPTKINETNNLSNDQAQQQGQLQGQGQQQKGVNKSHVTSVNVNENDASSYSKGGNASAVNANHNSATGGSGGAGGSGGSVGHVNSCIGIGSC